MFNYHNFKYYRNPWYIDNSSQPHDSINNHVSDHKKERDLKKNSSTTETIAASQLDNLNNFSNEVLFEIFGLKIYFDDLLLVCILLFLYQEGIQDEYLYIALILLLLS